MCMLLKLVFFERSILSDKTNLESNEVICEKCSLGACSSEGVELMKMNSTLRWSDHIERMENKELVNKLCFSKIEGPNKRYAIWKMVR